MEASGAMGGVVLGQISAFGWFVRSMGLFGLIAAILGPVIFVGALVVVLKDRRPAVIAAYFAFVPLPLLFALLGWAKNFLAAFFVVPLSDTLLTQSQIIGALTEGVAILEIGFAATIPSYVVIAIGLFMRTMQADSAATGSPGRPV